MDDKNNIKKIIIIVIILAILTFGYIILKKFTDNNENKNIYLKNYKANEYINTYISDEQMAKIYLSDYMNILKNDIEKAYDLLDDRYRQKKFSDIESFKKYIKKINYTTYTVKKYYVTKKSIDIIFGVYDDSNNLFIFKTNGVMQYRVYLDDKTVEI